MKAESENVPTVDAYRSELNAPDFVVTLLYGLTRAVYMRHRAHYLLDVMYTVYCARRLIVELKHHTIYTQWEHKYKVVYNLCCALVPVVALVCTSYLLRYRIREFVPKVFNLCSTMFKNGYMKLLNYDWKNATLLDLFQFSSFFTAVKPIILSTAASTTAQLTDARTYVLGSD